jgi:hypothetical protein
MKPLWRCLKEICESSIRVGPAPQLHRALQQTPLFRQAILIHPPPEAVEAFFGVDNLHC